MVIEHKSELPSQRLDDRDEITVVGTPAAMQHDDGLGGTGLAAVLGDVVAQCAVIILGIHVPLVDGHAILGGPSRRILGARRVLCALIWRAGYE